MVRSGRTIKSGRVHGSVVHPRALVDLEQEVQAYKVQQLDCEEACEAVVDVAACSKDGLAHEYELRNPEEPQHKCAVGVVGDTPEVVDGQGLEPPEEDGRQGGAWGYVDGCAPNKTRDDQAEDTADEYVNKGGGSHGAPRV